MENRILITRAANQAAEFAGHLERSGFKPIIFPVIEFVPISNNEKTLALFKDISSFHWLLLTSSNGVAFFMEALTDARVSMSSLNHLSICAVGPKTAEVAEKKGLTIRLIPENYQAKGVLSSFSEIGINGNKILFPRAEEGRDVLLEGLKDLGAEVELMPVYRTIKPEGKEEELKDLLKKGIDVITFTSGSTVRNFLSILGEENRGLLDGIRIACISEVTAKTAEDEGIHTDILPDENTTLSLAGAIKKNLV